MLVHAALYRWGQKWLKADNISVISCTLCRSESGADVFSRDGKENISATAVVDSSVIGCGVKRLVPDAFHDDLKQITKRIPGKQ